MDWIKRRETMNDEKWIWHNGKPKAVQTDFDADADAIDERYYCYCSSCGLKLAERALPTAQIYTDRQSCINAQIVEHNAKIEELKKL
jgi:hypothetical protein